MVVHKNYLDQEIIFNDNELNEDAVLDLIDEMKQADPDKMNSFKTIDLTWLDEYGNSNFLADGKKYFYDGDKIEGPIA